MQCSSRKFSVKLQYRKSETDCTPASADSLSCLINFAHIYLIYKHHGIKRSWNIQTWCQSPSQGVPILMFSVLLRRRNDLTCKKLILIYGTHTFLGARPPLSRPWAFEKWHSLCGGASWEKNMCTRLCDIYNNVSTGQQQFRTLRNGKTVLYCHVRPSFSQLVCHLFHLFQEHISIKSWFGGFSLEMTCVAVSGHTDFGDNSSRQPFLWRAAFSSLESY